MNPATSVFGVLRRTTASRLTRTFFTCQYASKSSATNKTTRRLIGSTASSRSGDGLLSRPPTAFGLTNLSSSLQSGGKSRVKFFPETSDKSVAYWLLGSAASVFGIVVFGGLTRLTESGYAAGPAVLESVLMLFKAEYHGMEAGDRLLAATRCLRLGCRVHQVSFITRVQAPKPAHDARRIQIYLLYGMDT